MDLLETCAKIGLIILCALPLVYVYAKADQDPKGGFTEIMYSWGLIISIMTGLFLFFHYLTLGFDFIIKPDEFWGRTILTCISGTVMFFVFFTINMTITKMKIKDETIIEQSRKIAKLENEIYRLNNK